jgi:hypothetical protein
LNIDLARKDKIIPTFWHCGLRHIQKGLDFSLFFFSRLLYFNLLYLLGIFDDLEVLIMDDDSIFLCRFESR